MSAADADHGPAIEPAIPRRHHPTMNLKEALAQLKALGNESVRARNAKNGAGENQYGVQIGDIRKLAKKIKADHELGLALWETENIDARLLAILLITPKKLSSTELERMVRSATFPWLADWLNAYVVKQAPRQGGPAARSG